MERTRRFSQWLRKVLAVGIVLWLTVPSFAQNVLAQPEVPDSLLPLAVKAVEEVADTLPALPANVVSESALDTLVQTRLAAMESDIAAQADSLLLLGVDSLTALTQQAMGKEAWSPDPARATWTALVFPGGGQIYNRKYWKLPIVYGGFLGCAYALNWNNQMYSDYSQAYLDIMDDDPGTASYMQFIPPRYDVSANEEYLKKVFKNRKDLYRRYRDLSIFSFIGVYLLSVVDAYVDAELSHFDISEDLGLQLRPSVIDNRNVCSMQAHSSYGLQCSFNF